MNASVTKPVKGTITFPKIKNSAFAKAIYFKPISRKALGSRRASELDSNEEKGRTLFQIDLPEPSESKRKESPYVFPIKYDAWKI